MGERCVARRDADKKQSDKQTKKNTSLLDMTWCQKICMPETQDEHSLSPSSEF